MKQQLPLSARDLLARQTAADEHPSADLLSGFLEHALSSNENARVTTHLAACADCREIVFLASAATPQEQQRAVAAAAAQSIPTVAAKVLPVSPSVTGFERPRFAWLSWKWVVPVLAALVIVAGVVVRQVTRTPGGATQTVAMNAPSSLPTSPPQTNALSMTTSESERAAAPPSSPKATAEAKASSKEEAQRREMEAKRQLEWRRQMASSLMVDQQAQLASPELAAKLPATTAAASATPQPAARKAMPQSFAKAARPQSLQADSAASTTVVSNRPNPVSESEKAEDLTHSNLLQIAPNTPNGGNDLTYAAKGGNDTAYLAKAASPTPPQPQRWQITQDGHLQRWTPAAQWTRMLADQPVSFKAVTVVGSEVWAGGSDGALFHSTDSGEHWTRVALVADAQPAHGNIRSIRFDTPAAGQVTTDSGETWSTADGGKTWSRH